jgi:hypothetical protein
MVALPKREAAAIAKVVGLAAEPLEHRSRFSQAATS